MFVNSGFNSTTLNGLPSFSNNASFPNQLFLQFGFFVFRSKMAFLIDTELTKQETHHIKMFGDADTLLYSQNLSEIWGSPAHVNVTANFKLLRIDTSALTGQTGFIRIETFRNFQGNFINISLPLWVES